MTTNIPQQYQSLKTKLETIVKKVVSPQEITANSDLNDYTEAGFYYCPNNTTSQTLTNNPTSNAFSLLVEKNGVGNGVKQTYTTYNATNHRTYVRTMYTDGWTDPSNPTDVWGSWELYFQDTGWTNITSFSSKFQNYYSNTEPLQFRRIGKIVHFRGLVKNKVEIKNGGNDEVIFTIPSDFRPSTPIRLVMQGSYSYTFLLVLNTNGNALVERYGNGTTYTNLSSTGVWMCLYGTYFID